REANPAGPVRACAPCALFLSPPSCERPVCFRLPPLRPSPRSHSPPALVVPTRADPGSTSLVVAVTGSPGRLGPGRCIRPGRSRWEIRPPEGTGEECGFRNRGRPGRALPTLRPPPFRCRVPQLLTQAGRRHVWGMKPRRAPRTRPAPCLSPGWRPP
uniref:Uncharacterized protein n=1 Tax=Varanus komodoensis TaxID=61221 RepID=A0A8D2L760_VARKO